MLPRPPKNETVRKHFRCHRFQLSLDLTNNGGITGKLFPFIDAPSVTGDIAGMYLVVNQCTAIAVTCDFSNPNLEGATQLFFSGEVFSYDGKRECMIIRWLANQNFGLCEICDRDIEILLDSKLENEQVEMMKIREHLNHHPLQVMC